MPRKKRLWSPDHYHHVVVRGNNRQTIFHNVADYDAFFRVLQYAYHKYSFKIVTYCVMSNHYHLLIRSPKVPLGKVMANVNWRYSNYFKKKYHYCGHLYESRYFADLVPSQLDMLSVSRYIHRNPISTSPLWLPRWRTTLIARIISTSMIYLQTTHSLIQVFSKVIYFKPHKLTHYPIVSIARNMKANHLM